jgi:hypothetical protein
MSAIDQILNVTDAGSNNMRCAARSVALILLSNNDNDLSAACREARVAVPPATGDPVGALAEALIKRAVDIIENNASFSDIAHVNHSHIIAALAAAEQSARSDETPQALVARYAQLMKTQGEMLDAPFFDALDIDQKSFITLEFVNGRYEIRRMSNNICLDQKIDTHSLEDIFFVVYVNRNHYRAVIRNGQDNQLALLRDIVKADMNKELTKLRTTLAQMSLTPANIDRNRNDIQPTIEYLITTYPADAKEAVIQALKAKNDALDTNSLAGLQNNNFAQAAVNAFLGSPLVEEVN